MAMTAMGEFESRLAKGKAERSAFLKLRYKIFVEEEGKAPSDEEKRTREETDSFDRYCEYMLVFHKKKVIGGYRIITKKAADENDGFYTETEFDISKIKKVRGNIAEMSRACIEKKYRENQLAISMLWLGLGNYILKNKIVVMFGVISYVGQKPVISAHAFSYLYYNHLAPKSIRAKVLPGKFDKMDILPKEYVDETKAFEEMTPLTKGYLRLGAEFGQGVFLDTPFNSYDIFATLQTRKISKIYQKRFLGKEGALDHLIIGDGLVKATAKITAKIFKMPFAGVALAANFILNNKAEGEKE
ncbi:MAG: GNAT family N-acetyltransferase [Rickettsiales bacterium]|jgi:putative hemolysin|nr:GNAT family N-acetyltransferase [Rickettsiales bacterium]